MEKARPAGLPGVEARVPPSDDAPGQQLRADRARRGVESRRVRCYAWSVFAVAAIAGLVLALGGSPLPAVGPVLLLAALVALSLNQLAFFPSEWSATAEAAVLVAAVVGFAGSAELLGPLAVAVLCGPLDVVHWRQHAYWRMAYNSGNRMIAALLGAVVFDAVHTGDGRLDFLLAAIAASVLFAVVDLVVFVGLEQLRGEQSMSAAVREDLFIDSLTLPLGLFGALAGYVATEVGWVAGALVLLPAPFAPELILIRARRTIGRSAALPAIRDALPATAAVAIVAAALAFVRPLPDPAVLGGLAVLAFLAGAELSVDTRGPVPPMLAAFVVAAAVVGGDGAVAGAVIVAVIATGTAWALAPGNRWWASLLAAVAAAAAGLVFDARPSRAGALAAAVVFEFVVVAHVRRVLWTAPLVCGAIALAYGWEAVGAPGAVVFGVGAFVAAATAATWGAPPWGSRVLGPWAARHPTGAHRAAAAVGVAVSLASAILALSEGADRAALVPLAAAAGTGVAGMAMVGVRQWRFAPRRRATDAALLLACTLAVLFVYPPLAETGDAWSLAVLGAALGVCATVAWPIASRADAARVS